MTRWFYDSETNTWVLWCPDKLNIWIIPLFLSVSLMCFCIFESLLLKTEPLNTIDWLDCQQTINTSSDSVLDLFISFMMLCCWMCIWICYLWLIDWTQNSQRIILTVKIVLFTLQQATWGVLQYQQHLLHHKSRKPPTAAFMSARRSTVSAGVCEVNTSTQVRLTTQHVRILSLQSNCCVLKASVGEPVDNVLSSSVQKRILLFGDTLWKTHRLSS